MEQFKVEKLEPKRPALRLMAARLATLLVAVTSLNTETLQGQEIIPADQMHTLVQAPPSGPVMVRTLDGNIRWYRNPQSTPNNIRYSIGATESPYPTLEQIIDSTQQPHSLTETDFYTNYLNALGRPDTILFDPVTGQPYQDPASFEEYTRKQGHDIYDGVRYQGGARWNVHRFLVEPHFTEAKRPINEARVHAAYDMFRYFLVKDGGNRDSAQQHLAEFMQNYVDPVTQGNFIEWLRGAQERLGLGERDPRFYTLKSNVNPQNMVNEILEFNYYTNKAAQFSRKEVLDALTNYYMEYEGADSLSARDQAEVAILNQEEQVRGAYQRALQKKPQRGIDKRPRRYDSWPIERQQAYDMNHPDAWQPEITEKDIEQEIESLRRHRWADALIIPE